MRAPREVHAAVSYLPDFFGLYEELTARQCLRYFHLAYRLPDPADRRIEEVLELVALRDAADRPIETLSRGMRQRLGLALYLIRDTAYIVPSILLTAARGRNLLYLFMPLIGREAAAWENILPGLAWGERRSPPSRSSPAGAYSSFPIRRSEGSRRAASA